MIYLRTQITLYEEDKKEASMRCSLFHGSWDQILERCPPVTPFSLCSHHRIIMKFSEVITIDRSDVHAKGQGQKSKVRVRKVKTLFSRFRTVSPVWFTYGDEMMHKAWCGIGEVPYCFSRSPVKYQGHIGQKIANFDPIWAFPDCGSSLNSPMVIKWCT